MLGNIVTKKSAHSQIATLALALAVFGSACGAAAGQQLRPGGGDVAPDSSSSTGQAQTSAGSSSLDYDTAQHMGRLNGGAGSSSLDYDTAQHMGPRGVEVKVP